MKFVWRLPESHSVRSSRLFVMGPQFSRLRYSLSRQLRTIPQNKPSERFCYSGFRHNSKKAFCQFQRSVPYRPLPGNAGPPLICPIFAPLFKENDHSLCGTKFPPALLLDLQGL